MKWLDAFFEDERYEILQHIVVVIVGAVVLAAAGSLFFLLKDVISWQKVIAVIFAVFFGGCMCWIVGVLTLCGITALIEKLFPPKPYMD